MEKKYVVTVIYFDDDGNYEVRNWTSDTRREARNNL